MEIQEQLDLQLLKFTRHEMFKQLKFMVGKKTQVKKTKLKGKIGKDIMKKLEVAKKKDILGMAKKFDRAGLEVPGKSKKESIEVPSVADPTTSGGVPGAADLKKITKVTQEEGEEDHAINPMSGLSVSFGKGGPKYACLLKLFWGPRKGVPHTGM